MTPGPELDADTGEVVLAEPTLTVLVNHTTERSLPVPQETDTRHELRLLRAASVLDEANRTHPLVARGLSAIADPAICTLDLTYAGQTMLGWAAQEAAALLLPPGEDERRRLAPLPRSLLPDALARLVDLGERPHPEPTGPVAYREAAYPDLRRHWHLSATPTAGNGAAGTRAIEVLDTPGGLWVLHPDENGTMLAQPTTPTTVLRSLVDLVTPPDAADTG